MLMMGKPPMQRERGMSIRGTPVDPDGHPKPHLGLGARPPAHRMPIILAFGDSHTQGQLGANWVELLQAKFRGHFRLVNCGVNGNVLQSVRQRVEPTLQAFGDDVVGCILMAGTNDALANINPSSRKLIWCYNPPPFLPDLPPLSAYPRILEELVATLYAHSSPFLQIVVLTPPLLGEDPAAPENAAIDQICEAIRGMVHKFTRGQGQGRGRGRGVSSSGSSSVGGGSSADSERRASSSSSSSSSSALASQRLRENERVEAVHADGTPLVAAVTGAVAAAAAEQQQLSPAGVGHHHQHQHQHQHQHGHRHRRLHVIDWNRRMRKALDEHYKDGRPRKRMEPRFLPMCFNTSVAVVGGTLAQSYNAISDARGFALLNDGVHMNERAVRLLVGLLERWVEDVQEELYRAPHLLLSQQMGRLRLTAAAPSPVPRIEKVVEEQQPGAAAAAAVAAAVAAGVVEIPIHYKTESPRSSHRAVSGAGSVDGVEKA